MLRSRTRNYFNEKIYFMLGDAIVVLALVTAAILIRPQIPPIGCRNMIILHLGYGDLTGVFLYLMDKYRDTPCEFYERTVIVILSVVYTFVVFCLINLLFFGSKQKVVVDLLLGAGEIVGITAADAVLNCVFRRYGKPTLLILDTENQNLSRMKKMKYGVLKYYNAWYENVEIDSEQEFEEFARINFPAYDAICVFDSMPDTLYRPAVNTAEQMEKELYIVPEIIDVGKTNARIVRFDDVLTLYTPKKMLNIIERFVKRATDIVMSAVGLLFTCLPMAVIAAAIKLTSPGPVFYKQKRLTQDKKEFDIYKFRTMVPDAEKESGPKFAEKDDPRITPIGKILRACRMDELPQFLNVLKGDMSIVGPRPERPAFVEQFEKEIEDYNCRFKVKAGLTSLSHVYGRYSTYIQDRTYYDLYYIVNYSLFLDFRIILLTTKTIFLKSSAEGEDEFKEKTVNHSDMEVKIP